MNDAAERLRLRYPPPRVPRAAKLAFIAVGVAIAMAWLIWAGLSFSRPAVSAKIAAYTVTSNTSISVTITVERRDPSVPVRCRIIAQSTDFQPVAEEQVDIEASEARIVNTTIDLVTLRRATAADVRGCVVS